LPSEERNLSNSFNEAKDWRDILAGNELFALVGAVSIVDGADELDGGFLRRDDKWIEVGNLEIAFGFENV
jgi:hypothetical protein